MISDGTREGRRHRTGYVQQMPSVVDLMYGRRDGILNVNVIYPS